VEVGQVAAANGAKGEYYLTVGYLTKTLTCRQRGDAYSAG